MASLWLPLLLANCLIYDSLGSVGDIAFQYKTYVLNNHKKILADAGKNCFEIAKETLTR